MDEYWKMLRQALGCRPLILTGSNVMILDGDNRVLLHLRTDIDMWGLPGGFCEIGETVEQTAIREAYEELNLTVRNLKLFNVYSGEDYHFTYPNGDEVYNISISYLCRDYEGVIQVNALEGKDAQFFSLENLPNNIPLPIKRVLEDLMLYLKEN
ncbi:MAG: NUDIX domain-containing protein [Clostridia bacterium]|nr:NUDIX domain-containing protein [Clostridia bacterium]